MRLIRYAALALLAGCSPSFAQENCAPTEAVYEKLETDFKEQRAFIAMSNQGAMFEIWANVDSDSWTLVVTGPDGISCVPAFGAGWESIPIVSGDPA